jgi:hypothetical protein
MGRTVSLSFLDIGWTVQAIEQGSHHSTSGPGAARPPIVCANQDICAWIAFSNTEQRNCPLWVVRERGEIISERVPFMNEANLVIIPIRTCCLIRR